MASRFGTTGSGARGAGDGGAACWWWRCWHVACWAVLLDADVPAGILRRLRSAGWLAGVARCRRHLTALRLPPRPPLPGACTKNAPPHHPRLGQTSRRKPNTLPARIQFEEKWWLHFVDHKWVLSSGVASRTGLPPRPERCAGLECGCPDKSLRTYQKSVQTVEGERSQEGPP